jgi:hypothetical protein
VAKAKLQEVVPKLVSLLGKVDAEDRPRAIQAALLTLGDSALPTGLEMGTGTGGNGGGSGGGVRGGGGMGAPGGQMTAQAYFKAKKPKNKIEELAVAARYREQYMSAETSSKAEFQDVVTKARLNFDASNFNRDIGNAKTAKLFNIGGDRDAYMLSAYGQDYVDALPDREALKELSPIKKRGKKKAAKAKK